jgi:hypothetical protein
LHWLVLGWFGARMRSPQRARDGEPVTIVAQLLATAPRPAAAPPPAGPAEPAVDSGALRGAAEAAVDVQSARRAGPAQAPAARATRSYRIDLPPAADITLDVARSDADGTRWSGEALLSWRLDGGRYRLKAEAGVGLALARLSLVVLDSEGGIDDAGFAPVAMTERRRGRALTATHFNRKDGTITFSASQNSYPLAAGAQDQASVPLQLAAIARGGPGQLSGNIDIQVAGDRDASVYRFVVLGQERIDTRLGPIATWHLSRRPEPGGYGARLDVWLAPGRGWYPVQISNTEASGAVTTQTVNNIVMTDTGS